MPRSKRNLLRRNIAHAYCDIDRAMEHLLLLKEEFEPVHPELGHALETMMQGCLMVEQLIDSFCDQAWGRHPADYQQWRNEKRLKRALTQEARGVEPTA